MSVVLVVGTADWGEPGAIREFVRALPRRTQLRVCGACWVRRVVEDEAAKRDLPVERAQSYGKQADWSTAVRRADYVVVFAAGKLPRRVVAVQRQAAEAGKLIKEPTEVPRPPCIEPEKP